MRVIGFSIFLILCMQANSFEGQDRMPNWVDPQRLEIAMRKGIMRAGKNLLSPNSLKIHRITYSGMEFNLTKGLRGDGNTYTKVEFTLDIDGRIRTLKCNLTHNSNDMSVTLWNNSCLVLNKGKWVSDIPGDEIFPSEFLASLKRGDIERLAPEVPIQPANKVGH